MFGDRVPDHSVPGLKVAKLICVTENNNNKYYLMWEQPDGMFKVAYGRVQGSVTEETFPMSRWNEKYKNKTGKTKGYKDVTHLYTVEEVQPVNESKPSILTNADPLIMKLIDTLQGYANKSISTNYTVTSDKVTQAMVDTAQEIIDAIVPLIEVGSSIRELNKMLLELYQIIPRKMRNVKDHLLNGSEIATAMLDEVQKMIHEEQTTLDVMAGQVQLLRSNRESSLPDRPESKSILDALGIAVTVSTADEISMAKKMMTDRGGSLHKMYNVVNKKTQQSYDLVAKNISKTALLFHGSRNQNWMNILQSGLLIKPAGAIHTGSMFGNSIYFADKADKSIGYSSYNGRWTNERESRGYIAIYDVALGKQMEIKKWQNDHKYLTHDKIAKGGYDSVFAHGGYDLRNNEFMVYKTDRCTIKHLIELK